MSDVTHILNALAQGDPHKAGELLTLVYDELRRLAAQKLAREAPGQGNEKAPKTDRRQEQGVHSLEYPP